MFSINKTNSPLGSSFEESVFQNQREIKNLETNYYHNGFEQSMNTKTSRVDGEKKQKEQQLRQYEERKHNFLTQMEISRQHKLQQKNYLANHYDQMIKHRKSKQNEYRNEEIQKDMSMLAHPTWIRDADTERQIYKQKMNHYSQELDRHVKQKEERKRQEQQQEKQMREKINKEAQQILKKDYAEMQKRFLKKSMFEERQNDLLGIGQKRPDHSSPELRDSDYERELKLRKHEQIVYEKGLQNQLKTEETRRRKQASTDFFPPNHYNPITNPLPIAYKNPNVLRMLGKK